jgi:hypothetical protein
MFQFTNPQSVLLDLLAFLLTAIMAFTFEWQANQLCWGLCVSSLLTGWGVIISSVLLTTLHLAGIPLLRKEDLNEKGNPLSAYFRSKSFGSKTKEATNPINSLPTILVALGTLAIGVFTWFHFTFFHTVHALVMSFFFTDGAQESFRPEWFYQCETV